MSCQELFKNLTAILPSVQPKPVIWQKQVYLRTEAFCNNILLPIIFAFGIIGNILNMIVLTRKRLRGRLNVMERSAILGLFGLAFSDLMFCVIGFVQPFISNKPAKFGILGNAAPFVTLDNVLNGLMNTFLLISTWIVVYFSVERFIGVRFPLKAREIVSLTRTGIAIFLIYVIAGLLNIPLFMKYEVEATRCAPKCTCYQTRLSPLFRGDFPRIYHIVWGILGTFIPLVVLLVCNITIGVIIMRRRRQEGAHFNQEAIDSAMRATSILLSIVVLYFLLVCPSMILHFLKALLPTTKGNHGPAYIFRTIQVVTNVTQGLSYAINFVLYCAISRSFREAFKHVLQCKNEIPKTTSIRHTHVTADHGQAHYPLVSMKQQSFEKKQMQTRQ